MITIDGYQWPVPCDIEREAEMTPSEISGMMLDKTYFNDVLGTYMRYDVSLAVPPKLEREYDEIYETLTIQWTATRSSCLTGRGRWKSRAGSRASGTPSCTP